MKVVDYEILVQDLIPPIGELNISRAFNSLVVETPEGNKRINLNLGETHGKTQDEARAKMQAKFDKWLKENS